MAKVKCEPGFTQLPKLNILEARKLTVDGAEVGVINPDHFTAPVQATFDTVNSFSMTGNHTEEFQIGRQVQLDSGQSSVNCNVSPEDLTPDDIFTVNKYDYSIITAIQYDGVITDVTIADSILTSDLEEASVSINWVDSQAGLITTTDLINSTQGYPSDFVLETSGFTTSGDGGGGQWVQNGIVAQTPSQTPDAIGEPLLNDANGNQWEMIFSNVLDFDSAIEIQAATIGNVGQRILCRERGGSNYILQPSNYIPLSGDLVLSSGLIASLQVYEKANVLWFGAVPDYVLGGGTDNTQAFLDCIARCGESSAGMYMPGGDYYFDGGRLDFEHALVYEGDGKEVTNLYFGGSPTKTIETYIKWMVEFNSGDYSTNVEGPVAYAIKVPVKGARLVNFSIHTDTIYTGYTSPWDATTDAPTSNYEYGVLVTWTANELESVDVWGVWTKAGLSVDGTDGSFGDGFSATNCYFSGWYGATIQGAEGQPLGGESFADLTGDDTRTNAGMSDIHFIRCQFSSTFSELRTRIQLDGVNRRARRTSQPAGGLYIHGQVKDNSAKRIQGIRFYNCRFKGSDIYTYYVNYANRVEFMNCHSDPNQDAMDINGGPLTNSDFAYRVTENATNMQWFSGEASGENDERALLNPNGDRVYSEFGFRPTGIGRGTLSCDILTDSGDFTPELSGSSGSATYGARSAHWVKLGQIIKIWGRIDISTIDTLSGSVVISIPFTADSSRNNTYPATFGIIRNFEILDGFGGAVSSGASEITLFRYNTNANINILDASDILDGSRIDFHVEILLE